MKLDSVKDKKKNLLKAVIMAGVVFGSGNVFADRDGHDGHNGNVAQYLNDCAMLPLVNTLVGGPVNTSVCVDAPVAMEKTKVVFNLDATVVDGKGRPTGLRHMMMLATAIKARINAGLVDPKDVSIIGVLHGSAISWALKSTPMNGWIEQLFTLNNAGVNVNLEVCGVTMLGNGYTNEDLYSSPNGMIHVNQGAIGRIIDLEQHKYAYMQEEK